MANTAVAKSARSRRAVSTMVAFLHLAGTNIKPIVSLLAALTLTTACLAQGQNQPQTRSQPASPTDSQTNLQASAEPNAATETIPAGTRFALVLTHPIQSSRIHRGDDIYAQITAPITLGNQVVIPPGALIDGKVDKLRRRGGSAELYLQSLSITFPDGYVATVPGPAVLESMEGYALNDPGQGRLISIFVLPAAGAGLGALIGHSVGKPDSEVGSTLPPGCVGGPPFCLQTSTPVFGTKGRDAIIGAGIGGAIGGVTAMALLFTSHHFFLDVGSPADMVLQKPLRLDQDQISDAVRQSEQQPVAEQSIAPRPIPRMSDNGTCYTPGTPGTPDITVPGPPGPDGIPGPPTIIPGTPATPGTPYPCP